VLNTRSASLSEHLFSCNVKGVTSNQANEPGRRRPLPRGSGEQLRDQLVAAATGLLLTPQASAAPSLRAIARECGVAPSAVYLHFASQDDLMAAVIEAQFGRLRHALACAREEAPHPAGRLTALGRAYYLWGAANPGAYQLLFERPDPVLSADAGPGLDLLDLAAAEFEALGHSARRAKLRSFALWSGLHGLTSLRIHKPAAPWPQEPLADLSALVESLC
jgi:AcrR family transcriptional regulator